MILGLAKTPDWNVIKTEVKKPNFKESILAFKKENISVKTAKFI